MRSKSLLNAAAIFLTLICSAMLLLSFGKKEFPVRTGAFRLSEYGWAIREFPSDKNVGQIPDARIGIQKAKALWIRNSV